MKNEDGAYFAIKGFIYQFDKTILEVLNQTDENAFVKIEQEQDLEYDNLVVQVKYYETVYSKPQQKQKIKEATLKLMPDFALDKSKNYCLFVYFNGEMPKQVKYNSVDELDKLLGNKASDYDLIFKEKFIKNFILVYATDFQKQFKDVIEKIQNDYKCKEEAYIYHALIRNKLLNIISENPISDYSERQINKHFVSELFKGAKNKIFHSAYAEYLGEEKYLKFLAQSFDCQTRNTNYLFIGNNIKETSEISFAELIDSIVHKYYLKANTRARGVVHPFNTVLQKSDDEIKRIKEGLIERNIWFNDGFKQYGFSEKYFNSNPVLETNKVDAKILHSSFFVRLISFDDFQKYEITLKPHKVFIFANDIPSKGLFDNSNPTVFAVNDIDISMIKKLFNKR
jgi:hypothetical protein